MPKGKTPSLIGSSLGRPTLTAARKRCKCSRCNNHIANGDRCVDVPQPSKPFPAPRRFCLTCFKMVVEKTKQDLTDLEATVWETTAPHTGNDASAAAR